MQRKFASTTLGYETDERGSLGNAAGGGYSEEGVCAAVEKIERANSAKIFSGTARGAKR